jgi:protein ImuB
VYVECGKPARLHADSEHAGEIIWAAGPWRESGDWWNEQAWSRDAWDIAVAGENVVVYRIYCEREQWFIEGTYD